MIRPKFANSKILLQWTINGEAHHSSVYRIYRGGTLIGYNTEDPSVNHWNGIAPAHYDRDDSSTPEQCVFKLGRYTKYNRSHHI